MWQAMITLLCRSLRSRICVHANFAHLDVLSLLYCSSSSSWALFLFKTFRHCCMIIDLISPCIFIYSGFQEGPLTLASGQCLDWWGWHLSRGIMPHTNFCIFILQCLAVAQGMWEYLMRLQTAFLCNGTMLMGQSNSTESFIHPLWETLLMNM